MNRDLPKITSRALSRRQLLSLAAGGALGLKLSAADLSGMYYREYARCLPDHLTALARAAYQKRNRDLAALTTPASIAKRQKWARETFWKLIGGEPERTPLNPRVTGRFEREGYRVENVVYESRPRFFVNANLYVPTTSQPPYPGVIFQMGHTENGKAGGSYQMCCQGLARLGYMVLAFDPMGQGERIFYPTAAGGHTRRESVDDEHTYPGKQLLLVGDSTSRFQVWDAVRSLDYLASHPLVDPERLASTGQSGGATVTMLLACVDSRLSAVVISSGITENFACANFNAPGSTDDAEQDFVGSGTLGFDRWDLLYPIAPKPMKIMVSARDYFGTYSPRYLSDGREEYAKLAKVYQTLGHRDRLDWGSTPLPHGLTYGLRLQTYNFFERWLKKSDRVIDREPMVAPEKDNVLWAGATGSVVKDFGSLRPIDLIREEAHAPRAASVSSSAAAWKDALQVRMPAHDVKLSRLGRTPADQAFIEGVEVQSAPEVWIPAWLFSPEKPDASHSTLLLLDERGRNVDVAEGGLGHRLARGGATVCAADVRAIGDSMPEVGRGNPVQTIAHATEEEYAWGSLILGEPLLAQRIADIVAMWCALRNDPQAKGKRLILAANGRLTIPALFAFAMEQGADELYLSGGLVSYASLLETENYRQPLANFAWNLFRSTDLPQVAASAAPRRIHLAGAVDGGGSRMTPEAVLSIYGSAKNVETSAEPAWNESVFMGLLKAAL